MRQAIPRSWCRHRVELSCALTLLLAAGLAGCGYSAASGQPVAEGTVSAGPPMATSTIRPATPYPYVEVPTSTAGWQTYTDSTYHFKTVIPPGWRFAMVLDPDSPSGGDCEYDAVYFPPGDTRTVEPRGWVGMHHYMRITIYLHCPAYDPSNDRNVAPVGKVSISGVSTTLYGQESNEEVDREAYIQFGGHPYTFIYIGESDQHTPITADLPLYMRVLRDFIYLGGK